MDTLILVGFFALALAGLAMVAWLLNDALLQLLGRYPYNHPEDDDVSL